MLIKQLLKVWCGRSLSMEARLRGPHNNGLNDEFENVQKRAIIAVTGILEELKWGNTPETEEG